MIPRINMHPAPSIKVTRNETLYRHYVLNELRPLRSIFDCASLQSRRNLLLLIIRYLNVEHSLRYRKEEQKTFCNIYAVDVAYLLGAYIPRVWWTEAAIKQLQQGESVKAEYGNTITELSANALFKWFGHYGALFQWKKAASYHHLSDKVVRTGTMGIVVAKANTPRQNGHICIVYYQKMRLRKVWLSEAGKVNAQQRFARWWRQFKQYGFYYLDVSSATVS
jgi:hypothetical protein